MKRIIYRNKKGRFISPEKFFFNGKKRYKSYSKQRIEYKEIEKKTKPIEKIRIPRYTENKATLGKRVNKKIEDLVPFGVIFEKDELERIKSYSLVGRYVKFSVEKFLKGKRQYTNKSDPRQKSLERKIRGYVYNAKLQGYMDILGVNRKEAQKIYHIINDVTHPQHFSIMEKVYGVRKGK